MIVLTATGGIEVAVNCGAIPETLALLADHEWPGNVRQAAPRPAHP